MAEYLRQVDGLDLTPVDDGFILYDVERDRVHYLNHAAALVLILCDGHNAAGEIPLLLQRRFDLPEPPEGEIAAVLTQLVDEGLVVPAGAPAGSQEPS